MRWGIALRTITLLFLVLTLGLIPASMWTPAPVLADPGPDFEVNVDYPSVTVEPGKTVSLNLRLVNRAKTGRQADLTLLKVPEGWKPIIKDIGRGYGVGSIYVGPEETRSVSFEAVPPDGIKPGNYVFSIKVVSNDGLNETLTVNVTVAEKVVSGTKVVSQYPVLRGPTGNKFEFKVDLSNGTGEDQTYNLSANAPQGWEISYQPAYENKQISTIRMKAGETGGLNIQVTPPKQEKAGEYPIDIQVSAGAERIGGTLKVVLTGTYEMAMTTNSGRLNMSATSGSPAPLSILIGNSGSADLSGVSLASSKPTGWEVNFDPKTVNSLAPGATREINVSVKPDEKAIAGDYLITLSASNPQVSKQLDIRVTVETPTVWGWVGVAIVVLVVGGLYGVFHSFSRR